MTDAATTNWHEANQRYLSAALAVVREALTQHAARAHGEIGALASSEEVPLALQQAAAALPAPSALAMLCAAFALSPFERDVLLLCAGMELDSTFAQLCGTAQNDPRRTFPTFSLALAALPEAHWSAVIPTAPLRYWRLIEAGTGESLLVSPLRIDERILHYLAGASHLDERLRGLVEPLSSPGDQPSSYTVLAQRIVEVWSSLEKTSTWPLIQLCGSEYAGKRAVAALACEALDLQAYVLRAADIPSAGLEREALLRLWE